MHNKHYISISTYAYFYRRVNDCVSVYSSRRMNSRAVKLCNKNAHCNTSFERKHFTSLITRPEKNGHRFPLAGEIEKYKIKEDRKILTTINILAKNGERIFRSQAMIGLVKNESHRKVASPEKSTKQNSLLRVVLYHAEISLCMLYTIMLYKVSYKNGDSKSIDAGYCQVATWWGYSKVPRLATPFLYGLVCILNPVVYPPHLGQLEYASRKRACMTHKGT